MREVMTKSMARNIFYGGSLFFIIIFLGLSFHSHRYIVTTSTNAALESLHHRMPVVLEPAQFPAWFDPEGTREGLEEMMVPAADDVLEAYEVDRQVNSVRNDGPACIEPIAGDPGGGSLFD